MIDSDLVGELVDVRLSIGTTDIVFVFFKVNVDGGKED
jgi:hypothetical protein